jgi:hypothetical protein
LRKHNQSAVSFTPVAGSVKPPAEIRPRLLAERDESGGTPVPAVVDEAE